MGALRAMIVVLAGAIFLCGAYSGLDIKYGDKGYYCWGAFCLLITALGGGTWRGTAAAALLAGGKAGGLEPFAVLLVSMMVSRILYASVFTRAEDDLKVTRKPYEEEIRELLFQNDPSRLHLVDAELRSYKGREKQLLREYEAEFAPALMGRGDHALGRTTRASGGSSGGGSDGYHRGRGHGGSGGAVDETSAYPRQKNVKEQAIEQEQRRLQASLDASVDRIMRRKANRR